MADSNNLSDVGRLHVELYDLARENGAVNLAQGCPDFGPPAHLLDALSQVASSSGDPALHQYSREFGNERLVKALSTLYSRFYKRYLDPLNDILVTAGGYGGLVCAIQSVVHEGDEVLVFEPYSDFYKNMIETAGGKPVYIPLRLHDSKNIHQGYNSDEWTFDEEYLLSHIGPNTKAILLNNPSNPMGKVFSRSALEIVRDMCIEFDLVCISDEVYEWLVYDKREFIKIGTMDGMWERTLTVGSAGKTFSANGWKVGWIIGPIELIVKCQKILLSLFHSAPNPTQEAVAIALETEINNYETSKCYLMTLSKDLQSKRDWIVNALNKIGLKPVVPGGGYFLMADISVLHNSRVVQETTHILGNEPEDVQFVRWAIKEMKFASTPASLFYSPEKVEHSKNYIRICFAKKQNTLQVATNALTSWVEKNSSCKA